MDEANPLPHQTKFLGTLIDLSGERSSRFSIWSEIAGETGKNSVSGLLGCHLAGFLFCHFLDTLGMDVWNAYLLASEQLSGLRF